MIEGKPPPAKKKKITKKKLEVMGFPTLGTNENLHILH